MRYIDMSGIDAPTPCIYMSLALTEVLCYSALDPVMQSKYTTE